MNAPDVAIENIVQSAVQRHREKIGPLLPVLHDIQESVGYIPAEAVAHIGRALNLSRAEIQGVLSFYHDFRSAPAGERVVHLCRSEACQAVGSRELENHVRQRLGIDYGQTTADGRFTLEAVYCLGNCACGPTIRVDNELHARVSPESFDALIGGQETDQP